MLAADGTPSTCSSIHSGNRTKYTEQTHRFVIVSPCEADRRMCGCRSSGSGADGVVNRLSSVDQNEDPAIEHTYVHTYVHTCIERGRLSSEDTRIIPYFAPQTQRD